MLLIVDNQSAYIKKFKRQFLAENDIDYVFFDHNQPLVIPDDKKVQGLILSGGRGNPFEPLNLSANYIALMRFDVPVIGFCLGHEIIAAAFGGRIKRLPEFHGKREEIHISKANDPIFKGIDKKTILLKKLHSFHVSEIPESMVSIAYSDTCQTEIIRHKEKPIYGFQGHPEVSGEDGTTILNNFLSICGIF